MQTIAINNLRNAEATVANTKVVENKLDRFVKWCEANRLGVVAIFILMQVTVAGFNVVIPPMTGLSTYLMAPGIAMAFLSNSIALAQVNMKWVIASAALSMLVNASISIYCFIHLLG